MLYLITCASTEYLEEREIKPCDISVPGGLCPGVSVRGSLSGGRVSLSSGALCIGDLWRVSVQGGLCLGGLCPGVLCPGGLCLGGLCLEVSVREVGSTHPTGMHSCSIFFFKMKRSLSNYRLGMVNSNIVHSKFHFI